MPFKSQAVLLSQAEEDLSQSNKLLASFKSEWDQSDHPLDDVSTIRTMQLILQYRLDTQSALYQMGKLQQYLLQLLGIESQHSAEINIERLAHALGSDDLKHILSMLNRLIDSLLRIIAHSQNQKVLDRKQAMERLKKQKHIAILEKVLDKQRSFVAKMKEVRLALEDVPGAPQPGVIFDHIAALEGPISRFYQALQNGLILGASLYQQMELKPHLELPLSNSIQSPEQVLHDYKFSVEQQRLFSHPNEHSVTESLEKRAAEKRLGNFFNR